MVKRTLSRETLQIFLLLRSSGLYIRGSGTPKKEVGAPLYPVQASSPSTTGTAWEIRTLLPEITLLAALVRSEDWMVKLQPVRPL